MVVESGLVGFIVCKYYPFVFKLSQLRTRLIFNNWEAIEALHLNIPKHIFARHQVIGLLLDGICASFVPSAVDEFDAAEFKG